MLRTWGGIALAGIAAGSIAACSSSNEGDDDGYGDVGTDGGTPSGGAIDFITDYCTAITSCCAAMTMPSDLARCKQQLDHGEGTHDTTSEKACLAAIQKSASTSASWCSQQSRDDQEICALAVFALYQGEPTRGKLGDECVGSLTFAIDTNNEPQAKGTVCYQIDGLACRIVGGDPPKCLALAAVDQPCNDDPISPLNCVYDAYCDGASRTCKAYAGFGESCSAAAPCEDSYHCTNGTCGPKLPPGATCSDGLACESGSCRAQTADATTLQCDPGLGLWSIGPGFCQATAGGS